MNIEDTERIIATFVAVHFNIKFDEPEPRTFTLLTPKGNRFALLYPMEVNKIWTDMNFKGALVFPKKVWNGATKLAAGRNLAFAIAIADREMEIWLAQWRDPFPKFDSFEDKRGEQQLWIPTTEFTVNIRDRGPLENEDGSV